MVGAQVANLVALLLTAVANTAANRRLTFGVRGRGGAARHQAQGLVVFALGLALTSGSLLAPARAPPPTPSGTAPNSPCWSPPTSPRRCCASCSSAAGCSAATHRVDAPTATPPSSRWRPPDDRHAADGSAPPTARRAPPARRRRPGPVRGREADAAWVRPALLGPAGSAPPSLYLWDLGASGWANAFYSAAAQAGSQSWKAFFFGSSDAANSITVDKPPASLWVMALSVRLFGLNSWSILVPQALMGVATVGVLTRPCAVVRPGGGPARRRGRSR